MPAPIPSLRKEAMGVGGGHKSLNLDTSESLNPNDAVILGTFTIDNMLRVKIFM